MYIQDISRYTRFLRPSKSLSLSRCAQGRGPMKSQLQPSSSFGRNPYAQGREPRKRQQQQKTKRQATQQKHPKAEPEQPEKSKSTASRDYAITWVPPSIMLKWRGLRGLASPCRLGYADAKTACWASRGAQWTSSLEPEPPSSSATTAR